MQTENPLQNAYIGEYVEWQQTFVITNVPNDNSNVYTSIAQSWKTIESVKFELTTSWTSNYPNDVYFRISWTNNTTNRYGGGVLYRDGAYTDINNAVIRGRINGNTDGIFWPTISVNAFQTNTISLKIGRESWIYIVNWTTQTWNYTTTEKNIVETILNSWTTNAYASRQGGASLSDVVVTVIYS